MSSTAFFSIEGKPSDKESNKPQIDTVNGLPIVKTAATGGTQAIQAAIKEKSYVERFLLKSSLSQVGAVFLLSGLSWLMLSIAFNLPGSQSVGAYRSFLAITGFMLGLGGIIVSGWPFFYNAYDDLKSRIITVNVPLVFIPASLAFIELYNLAGYSSNIKNLDLTGMFVPQVIALLSACYLYLTRFFKARLTSCIQHVLYPASNIVRLVDHEALKQAKDLKSCLKLLKRVHPSESKLGDLYFIKAGDVIPLDGKIIDGTMTIEEKRFSLSADRVIRTKSQKVYGGSKVIKGQGVCIIEDLLSDGDLSSASQFVEKVISQSVKGDLNDYRTQKLINALLILIMAAIVFMGGWLGKSPVVIAYAIISIAASVTLGLVYSTGFALRRQAVLEIIKKGFVIKSAEVLEKIAGVKQAVLEYDTAGNRRKGKVIGYRFLDNTVDRKKVLSKLLLMLSLAKNKDFNTLGSSLMEEVTDPELYEVSAFSDIESGIGAVIHSDTYIFGTETALMALGVFFQSSDVRSAVGSSAEIEKISSPDKKAPIFDEQQKQTFYLSINNEIVASFLVNFYQFPSIPREVARLKTEASLKTSLISENEKKQTDLYGKSMGFDLASIHAGLSSEEFQKKLMSFKDACFFSNRKIKNIDTNILTISHFDNVIREYEQTDVISFNDDLNNLSAVFSIVNRSSNIKESLFFSALIITLIGGLITIYSPIYGAVFAVSALIVYVLAQYTLLGVCKSA